MQSLHRKVINTQKYKISNLIINKDISMKKEERHINQFPAQLAHNLSV